MKIKIMTALLLTLSVSQAAYSSTGDDESFTRERKITKISCDAYDLSDYSTNIIGVYVYKSLEHANIDFNKSVAHVDIEFDEHLELPLTYVSDFSKRQWARVSVDYSYNFLKEKGVNIEGRDLFYSFGASRISTQNNSFPYKNFLSGSKSFIERDNSKTYSLSFDLIPETKWKRDIIFYKPFYNGNFYGLMDFSGIGYELPPKGSRVIGLKFYAKCSSY